MQAPILAELGWVTIDKGPTAHCCKSSFLSLEIFPETMK